jgi:hypothetical protein
VFFIYKVVIKKKPPKAAELQILSFIQPLSMVYEFQLISSSSGFCNPTASAFG